MQIESRRLTSIRALPAARKIALGAALCLAAGIVILFAGSRVVNVNEPHLWGPLNDQIAYINVARSLLEKGRLESNTVLPSTLWQKNKNDVLYMPGHPAAIALSYKLFGVGAFQSVIPSLLSYLIAMLAIYFIGVRCYSPTVGLIASLLFALFPTVLFFALTAMAELTFVAAFTAAVCGCLYLPHRWRPWLGPFCLAVPFLFRETAAFVAIPLGLFFWWEQRDKLAWRSVVFVFLTVVVLAMIFRADFSAGRPSLWKAGIFGDWHAVYDDAIAQQAISHPAWHDWLRIVPGRVISNGAFLFYNQDYVPWASGANYTIMAVMALVALAAVLYRDKLAWSFSVFNLISMTALVTVFSVSGYRSSRYLLFVYALSVVVIARLMIRVSSRIDARRLIIVGIGGTSAAALSLFSLGVVRNTYSSLAVRSLIDSRHTITIVNLGYLLAMLVGAALVWRYLKRRRGRKTEVSEAPAKRFWDYSALGLATIIGFEALFDSPGYRSMRYLLFSYTLSIVLITWLMRKIFRRIPTRQPVLITILGLAALLAFSLLIVSSMYTFLAAQDATDLKYAAALESVGHNNTRMLVTPFGLSTRYRYDHFPVRWAFLPENPPTLNLLATRFDIGTLILRDDHPLLNDPATLAALGFYKEQTLVIDSFNFLVYKRPPR
jgi:hypothetical protein